MERAKSSNLSSTTRPVVPWNKGAFLGPKPPFKPKQVWSIRLNLQREKRIRDLALFDLAIDSKWLLGLLLDNGRAVSGDSIDHELADTWPHQVATAQRIGGKRIGRSDRWPSWRE